MNLLAEIIRRGGPAVVAIMVLSVVLYSRCFKLLFSLRRMGEQSDAGVSVTEARRMQREISDYYYQRRIALVAMISAAPLLGLLGTVSGMVRTFESLSATATGKSMEGLAGGVSEVLVSTESGLLVALPALVLVGLAHREMSRQVRQLNQVEEREMEGSP
jgi:biopolymer transport protein ExbB/TolQ